MELVSGCSLLHQGRAYGEVWVGTESGGGEELLRGEENGGSRGRAPACILEERGACGGKSYGMGDIGGVRDWSPARIRWD